MKKFLLISLLLLGYAASAMAAPLVGPLALSLADAERLGMAHSNLLAQAQARERQALAKGRQTAALNNPTLSVAGHVGQNTGGLDEDVILAQTFQLGGKRTQPILQARAELAAAHAQTEKTRIEVVQSVDNAYYDAARAEAEVRLQREFEAISQTFAEAAKLQYEAGDVARSNVVRSDIELSRVQQALASAQADRSSKHATLRSLTGLEGELALTDANDFVKVGYTLDALKAYARQHAPDIVAARRLTEARAAAWKASRAQATPDIVMEARSQYVNPFTGGTSIRAAVVFPIFDFGSLHAASRAAEGALQEQLAAVAEAERLVDLDVETSYWSLQQAQASLDALLGGRLARSAELLGMLRTGYERGASTYLELLDAQRGWFNDQADYARAVAAYNTALAALRRAVGGTLP